MKGPLTVALMVGAIALAAAGYHASILFAPDGRQGALAVALPAEALDGGAPDGSDQQPEAPVERLTPPQPRPAPARAIAPSIVAPPDIDPGDLQRIEPREPLTRLALALPPERPEMLRLDRPVASAAGVFAAGGFRVTISGITPPAASETCDDEAGRAWPCGAAARTAFRAFLRGRSVECRIDPALPPGDVSARCALAGQDLARWLVANGWARASDPEYRDASDAARSAGRGMFGRAPAAMR